jgi:RNA-directed DNA polymerase
MKRVGNLMYIIAEINNLYLAWIKAKKGKAVKADVIQFEKNLDNNIKELQIRLLSDRIEVGKYHYFTITDPKQRLICAASFPERILHHALMNICGTVFERHLIFDTYATRKNKGTYAALDRARIFAKRYKYYIKLDVCKYFDSIDHEIMKKKLSTLFKDNQLLSIFYKIIESYRTDNNKGLPIGNLTSQYFANHYLSEADHFASEQLQIPGYIRYMDDILLFGNTKGKLLDKVQAYMKSVSDELKISFKPLVHASCNKGLLFLGYKIFPFTVKLSKRSMLRFKTKLISYTNNLSNGLWNQSVYQQHVLPLLSFVQYADSLKFRKNVLQKI